MTLTLAEAKFLIAEATSAARRLKIRVCVAVCNREGHLIAFERMDGTYAEADRLAVGKAVVSAGTGLPSGEVVGTVYHAPTALVVAEGMPSMRVRGGLPVLRDNEIVGGCGVAGGPSDETDEECTGAAIAKFHDYHRGTSSRGPKA